MNPDKYNVYVTADGRTDIQTHGQIKYSESASINQVKGMDRNQQNSIFCGFFEVAGKTAAIKLLWHLFEPYSINL